MDTKFTREEYLAALQSAKASRRLAETQCAALEYYIFERPKVIAEYEQRLARVEKELRFYQQAEERRIIRASQLGVSP